jgi:hypothetical protein
MADDVGDLIISGTYETGLISRRSVESLLAVEGIERQIALGLGSSSGSESVFLVTVLADDSQSIFRDNNAALVAEGHNNIVDELKRISSGGAADDVLLLTRYINGKVLNPCTTLEQATLMNSRTYQEGGMTPLYDQSVATLGTVLAMTAKLTASGIKVRTFTLIITDGADELSRSANAQSVAWIVGDLLLTGSNIVAAMGVSDGVTNFQRVFSEIGIKPGWILTTDNSRDKIRQAFREVTATLALAAGGPDDFTALALGPGFA